MVLWNLKEIYQALMKNRRELGYCVEEERNNWTEILPKEVLGMVFRRLTLLDRVRAGAVCRRWRLVVKESTIHGGDHCSPVPDQLPWLMMAPQYGHHTGFDSTVKFYSLSEDRFYTISLPRHALCTGSYLGWMMIHRSNQTFLLNPISGVQIALPTVSTHWLCSPKGFKNGVFSLSAPFALENSPPSCLVIGVTSCGDLAYCTPGDALWSELKAADGAAFLALAFHKEGLYVLDSNGDVVVFDHLMTATGGGTKLGILHPVNHAPNFFMDDHKHLVSMGEDLLLVLKRRSWHEFLGAIHPRFHYAIRTDNFEIFKLDREARRWVEMDGLGGAHMLFWGIGHMICLSAASSEIRGGGRGDCIYFMEPPNVFGQGEALYSDFLKIFKMEDGVRCIEPYFTGGDSSHLFFPKGCTWFIPYHY